MILIDIGSTIIKIAVYEGKKIKRKRKKEGFHL